MQLALGKSPSAYRDNMELLSKELSGLRGLLFTNKDRDAVREIFDATAEKDFARSGFKCSEKVTLSAGPLTTMAHSMVEQLRKAGLQVILVRGVVTLEEDHCICRPGDILNPDQAHLLKLFDHKVAEFRLKICAQWRTASFNNNFYERRIPQPLLLARKVMQIHPRDARSSMCELPMWEVRCVTGQCQRERQVVSINPARNITRAILGPASTTTLLLFAVLFAYDIASVYASELFVVDNGRMCSCVSSWPLHPAVAISAGAPASLAARKIGWLHHGKNFFKLRVRTIGRGNSPCIRALRTISLLKSLQSLQGISIVRFFSARTFSPLVITIPAMLRNMLPRIWL